jgi:hypothetical protein
MWKFRKQQRYYEWINIWTCRAVAPTLTSTIKYFFYHARKADGSKMQEQLYFLSLSGKGRYGIWIM